MAKYINNTTQFDTYGSNITYNFDYVVFTEDTLTTNTPINIQIDDTTITYDIIRHYTNKLDLTKINTVNLKITNTFTQSTDYLLTDMYITKSNNTSIGILNSEYLTSSEGTNIIYRYYTILKCSPLTKNAVNTANNVYIITPLNYTNKNIDTISQSTNIVLSVKSIDETTILNTPEIIINNVNSINELIKSDSEYFFIDSPNKIIMFKNPVYIGVIGVETTIDKDKITSDLTLLNVSATTEYENVENGKSPITKNNAIGQTTTELDSNIYINCHPIDDGGRIIPKADNTNKTNDDIKISIIFFGLFFTFGLFVYIYLNRNELFMLMGDSANVNSLRFKYGIMLFVFLTSWIFIGINIDNMPD